MILGIAGKIGTGKSTVARMIQAAGSFAAGHLSFDLPAAKIIEADRLAHDLLLRNEVETRLIAEFGDSICENGHISRERLGDIVFTDHRQLLRLTGIVHPPMREKLRDSVQRAESAHVILVAALPLSLGLPDQCERILVLTTEQQEAWRRVERRDRNMTADRFGRIWQWQAQEYNGLPGLENASPVPVAVSGEIIATGKCLPESR